MEKSELLKMFAPKVVPIEVEREGEKLNLHVRQLSARQVFALQAKQKEGGVDNEAFALFLISEAVCDESGNRILDQKDAKTMLEMHVKAFTELVDKVAEAVGLKDESKAEPGNVSGAIH